MSLGSQGTLRLQRTREEIAAQEIDVQGSAKEHSAEY